MKAILNYQDGFFELFEVAHKTRIAFLSSS